MTGGIEEWHTAFQQYIFDILNLQRFRYLSSVLKL
jgi:hypothetical protein